MSAVAFCGWVIVASVLGALALMGWCAMVVFSREDRSCDDWDMRGVDRWLEQSSNAKEDRP